VGKVGKLETAVSEFVFEFEDPARQFLGRFSFGLLEVAPLQVVVPEPSGTDGLVRLEDETEEFTSLARVDILFGLYSGDQVPADLLTPLQGRTLEVRGKVARDGCVGGGSSGLAHDCSAVEAPGWAQQLSLGHAFPAKEKARVRREGVHLGRRYQS
jgi:hypothetical protein